MYECLKAIFVYYPFISRGNGFFRSLWRYGTRMDVVKRHWTVPKITRTSSKRILYRPPCIVRGNKFEKLGQKEKGISRITGDKRSPTWFSIRSRVVVDPSITVGFSRQYI